VNKLRVLDLFSGIGGFSLGLERTGGFETVAFCEIEPFPRRVLAKHWPEVPCYDDVRTLTASRLAADGIAVDAICGGFPCQDISVAGKGAGLAGERSGLWREYARLVGELRPRFVIVENVGALLSRGLDAVLGSMAALGYDAEWHCIPAAYVGGRHIRDRVWIVAYASSFGFQGPIHLADSLSQALAYDWRQTARATWSDDVESWASEPAFLGKNDDVPYWLDRVAALGNAVVPEIPELIGNAILASLKERQVAEAGA
jgi:DNA (cytosine-5)-methyltransferase 1